MRIIDHGHSAAAGTVMMFRIANDNGSRRIMYLREWMGSGLKILCRRFNPVPAHHSFQPVARFEILPGLGLCPDLCPGQAHSIASQRTSVLQAVATRSSQIQLERALLTRAPVFFFGPRFDLPCAL